MPHFTTCITLGAIIAVLPLTGLPVSWEQWMSGILGALVALIAWRGRRVYRQRHEPRRTETFEENGGAPAAQPSESLHHHDNA